MKVLSIDVDESNSVLPWKACVGECPVWDDREGCLYWVDILEKRIHRFFPLKNENDTFTLPEIVPCIALREAGGLVLTLRKNFAFFEPKTGQLEVLSEVESDQENNRFNDGKCDPQGRFWAGTMNAEKWDHPVGHLFRFDSGHEVQTMRSEVVCSNGTGWSPDSRTMYHTESFRYTVFQYDFDPETGAISGRRTFFSTDKEMGFPDGLTVDSEGFVWSSIVGPGHIHRYDPDGKLERVIEFPVSRATCSTFGGPDLSTLYVTTSRETLTASRLKEEPLAGNLFALETGIRGIRTSRYLG